MSLASRTSLVPLSSRSDRRENNANGYSRALGCRAWLRRAIRASCEVEIHTPRCGTPWFARELLLKGGGAPQARVVTGTACVR